MDDKIKTSQDIWSGVDGQDSATAPAVQYGTETSGAPGPVTQPMKGESSQIDGLSTSQQRADEHHTPES